MLQLRVQDVGVVPQLLHNLDRRCGVWRFLQAAGCKGVRNALLCSMFAGCCCRKHAAWTVCCKPCCDIMCMILILCVNTGMCHFVLSAAVWLFAGLQQRSQQQPGAAGAAAAEH
jgi:hypothetical protein